MALCVAIGHYFYWNDKFDVIPLSFILSFDYFFILSGFVLSWSVLKKNEFDSFDFAKSRLLRLYPVYIFAVLLTYVMSILLHVDLGEPDLGDIVKILSIGEILPFVKSSNFVLFEPLGVAWGISSGLWIGIIFFPILYVLNKKLMQLIFPFLILTILICFFTINNYSTSDYPTEYMNLHYHKFSQLIPFGLIRGLLGYALGAFIYYIVQYLQKNSRIINENVLSVVQIITIFLIIYLYAHNGYKRSNEYYSVFIFSILITSLSFNKGVVFKWTNNIVGDWFGRISYPLFLLHPVFILINKKNVIFLDMFSVIAILFYIVYLLIASILVHKYIEEKFILYFNKKST
ncbi:hypothetical protein A9G13_05580 [Gilliamella sp. wkB178]|nr:hypothetical protein A9G13_05580 [Gilliamella apicola]